MNVTGACHCGKIKFKAKVDPRKISICHCTDCQILTGCAYRVSAHIPVNDFELLSGQMKTYVKTAENGNKRAMTFCPDCGTPFYAEAAENPTVRSLRVGTLDQRKSLPPTRQIWCRSALPWSQNISGVEPKFQDQGPATVKV